MVTDSAAAEKPLGEISLFGPDGDILAEFDKREESFRRVQALVAQWLRMENVVVLLGAGASVSQGGLLVSKLEAEVLSILEELCKAADLQECAPIIGRRLELTKSRKTTIHFEKWLSYITNAEHILCSGESPIAQISFDSAPSISGKELQKLLLAIGFSIYATCSLKLSGSQPHICDSGHHAFLAKLVARDPNFGRAHIFTTNYDTLIEQALDQLGIRYTDGFTGTIDRRFDASSYGLDLYYPGEVAEGRVRRFDKFLHLYKLHGSVHWKLNENGRFVQTCDDFAFQQESWRTMSFEDKAKEVLHWIESRPLTMGILPTANKFVETLELPFAHIFRAFNQRLQIPQTFLLVSGYSFGDDHINALIDDAMTNPSVVMLVVNPMPDKRLRNRIECYQKSGERAFLLCAKRPSGDETLPATFDDFSKRIMPNVQWIEDFVKLRIMEKQISDQKSEAQKNGGVIQHGQGRTW